MPGHTKDTSALADLAVDEVDWGNINSAREIGYSHRKGQGHDAQTGNWPCPHLAEIAC